MLGGMLTIIAIGIIFYSFIIKLGNVNSTNENDAQIKQYDFIEKIDETPVKHKNTQLTLFHVVRKGGRGNFYTPEFDRYIKLRYYQINEDWNKKNPFT